MAFNRYEEMTTMRRVKKSTTRLSMIAAFAIFTLVFWASVLPAQETIDPRTGLLFMTETDLVVDAGAVNLEVHRWLQQGESDKGLLGTRWRMNWETRLHRNDNTVFIKGNGTIIQFDLEAGKALYQSLSGERIVFDSNGQATCTKPDGTKELFNAQGRLIQHDMRNGNQFFLSYDDSERLTRVDGPKGSFLQFTADQTGRISLIKASTGDTIAYSYAEDDLTEVQANSGESLSYQYDTFGALIRVDHPQTGIIKFAYDANGRVLSRHRADGSQERYEYDNEKNSQRHINAGGGITTSQWSSDYRRGEITDPLGNVSVLEYDEAGRLTKVTGPTGAVVEIEYDGMGRTVTIKDSDGQITRFEYVGESSLVKSIIRPDCAQQVFEYDAKGNLKRVMTGTTTTAALSYYPDGLMESMRGLGIEEISFAYDVDGRLKSQTNALGDTTQFEYDARGNLTREVNPLGGETLWKYDALNRLVSQTDPVGGTTRYDYDTQSRLAQLVEPSGSVSRYDYDSMGRVVAETDAAGRKTRYDYDMAGRLESIMGPGNGTERFSYDKAGNLAEWTDQMGQVTTYQYDSLGRLIREKQPNGLEIRYRYNALGQLMGAEDTAGSKSAYQRNLCGRLTTSKDSLDAITRYEYDPLGNLIASIDPLSQVKRFSYTSGGQTLSVREPSGDEARYGYDAVGRLVEIRRPSGGVVNFKYDAMGNMISKIDPLKNEYRYSYDPAGHLLSTTDPAGRVTQFNYDGKDRLIKEHLPDGKGISHKYDAVGNLIQADDGAFPINYSYDSKGRITKKEYSAIRKSVVYRYDAQGLPRALIDPKGQEIQYEYNNLKQLKAVVLPDLTRISFEYDLKGRISTIQYPNGVSCTREYDAEGRITAIQYKAKNGNMISRWTYQYDATGNLVKQTDHKGQTTQFEYDPAGQLTDEKGPGYSIRYRYLPGGNRAEVDKDDTRTTCEYDLADRLIRYGSETLAYDKNGRLVDRMTPDGKTHYEYDTKDRLIAIVGPDGKKTTYGYAPTGERIWKKDQDDVTYYLYDGLDLISELKKTGESRVSYIHAPGIDQPLAMIRDGLTYYYHADRLGSIRSLTDELGAVVAGYDYDAFGNLMTQEASVPNPFTFTAREFDTTTGLYYYRARYYDPRLGRFLTIDPIGAAIDEPLEQNPYLYVMNNPTRFTDPLGLSGIDRALGYDPMNAGTSLASLKQDLFHLQHQLNEMKANPKFKLMGNTGQFEKTDFQKFETWIRNLKNEIKFRQRFEGPSGGNTLTQGSATGGSVPKDPTGAIRGGRQGPNTAVQSGAGTPDPSTINIRPASGTSGTKVPWYRRTTGPKAGIIAGGTISGVLGIMSYNACVEEGGSRAWCFAKASGGAIIGTGIGIGAGILVATVAAKAAVVGGAVAGTAVIATATAVGVQKTWQATAAAAQRWGAAKPNQKLRQQAGRQGPTAQAVQRTLNSIDGQIEALRKLGQEVQKSKENTAKDAEAAVKSAKDASAHLAIFQDLHARVNNMMTTWMSDCINAQNWLKDVRQSAEWAKRAKQGFEGADALLSNCINGTDVDATDLDIADSMFEAARNVAQSANSKYDSAKSTSDAVKDIMSRFKKMNPDLPNDIKRAEETYYAYIKNVEHSVKRTKDWAKITEEKYKQFKAEKNKLISSLESQAIASLPSEIMAKFNKRYTQVRKTPPVNDNEVKTNPLVQKAENALSGMTPSTPSIQQGIAGALQSLSLLSKGVDYATMKAKIAYIQSACQQVGDPEAEFGQATQAVSAMGDTNGWFKRLSNQRNQCMTKLKKQPSQSSSNLRLTGWGLSPMYADIEEGGEPPSYQCVFSYSDYTRSATDVVDRYGLPRDVEITKNPGTNSYTVSATCVDPEHGIEKSCTAQITIKKEEEEEGSPIDESYGKFGAMRGEKEKEHSEGRSESEGIDTMGFYKAPKRAGFTSELLAKTLEEQEEWLAKKKQPTLGRYEPPKPEIGSSSSAENTPPPATSPAPSTPASGIDQRVLFQTINLPFSDSSNYNKVWESNLPPKSSQDIEIEVSGTVSIWKGQSDGMDAVFCYDERKGKCGEKEKWLHGILLIDGNRNFSPYYRLLTGTRVSSGKFSYNANHTYTAKYTQRDEPRPIKFTLCPKCPWLPVEELSGSLTVKIYIFKYVK